MTTKTAGNIKIIRILSQTTFLLFFLYLFLTSGRNINNNINSPSEFFYFDPLIFIVNIISSGKIIAIFLLSLIPLFLSLFLGRFFCGWICPMGTINHFFSWILRKKTKKLKEVDQSALKIKYIILIMIIIAAIFGENLSGYLDPFSLLTRSIAALTSVTQPVIIGGIFILLIALNVKRNRFFCNVLCPLGALFGLVSRFGIFRMKVGDTCNECETCIKKCSYQEGPAKNFNKAECIVCFDCATECDQNSVSTSFALEKVTKNSTIDIGRRKAIASIATGIAVVALTTPSVLSMPFKRHSFLRPPGATNEDEFLVLCSRCGMCIQSCPTGFIQPALLESGPEGFWTPVAKARKGGCSWECNNCTQICPTEAIQKLSIKEKQKFQIGIAVIDKNKCYTYSDGFNCTACEEVCPTPEKAIQFRKTKVWNYEGYIAEINQIYIKPELCIGCGLCEYLCPRHDAPGIFITSEEELRERFSG